MHIAVMHRFWPSSMDPLGTWLANLAQKLHVQTHLNPSSDQSHHHLPVRLGNALQLVLLLDRVRVAATLGSVDQLLGEALGDALDVTESRFASTDSEEGNSLVDTAERRHIDGLSSDGTGRTDTGAVFARAAVDDGIDGDLDRVLIGHDVDLKTD